MSIQRPKDAGASDLVVEHGDGLAVWQRRERDQVTGMAGTAPTGRSDMATGDQRCPSEEVHAAAEMSACPIAT